MLQSLHIENIAVIKSLDIDFESGFSVLSGETGAGKSIIIDSINMLSGNRVSREIIRTGEEKATVSAVFTDVGDEVKSLLLEYGFDADDSVMLQHTVTRDGKTVVKINGRTVTRTVQKEICKLLINIHGQNDNQRLMQRSTQMDILDGFADNGELLAEYRNIYNEIISNRSKLDSLMKSEAEQIRLCDMLEFQLNEINSVKLKEGEEDLLVLERDRLANIEKIEEKVNFAYKALYSNEKGSAIYLIDRSVAALNKISDVVPEAKEFSGKLTDYRYEIEDIALSIKKYTDKTEDPTGKLNKIESRLDAISKLKRKYGSTVEEILKFRDDAAKRLNEIDNIDNAKNDLTEMIEADKRRATVIAEKLRERRINAGTAITEKVARSLEFLDMPKVRFEILLNEAKELLPSGIDEVEFLISANSGEPLMPLEKIASGGELSRIMLSLKSVLSDKDGVGTVIYDEIDSGVSGRTSRKIGIKLKEISRDLQVICVTHSAQIASVADNHYLISKREDDGRTYSGVELLDENGRIDEIARILGGISVTDAQRTAAREMIEEGKEY